MFLRNYSRPAGLTALILVVVGLLPAAAPAQSGAWITSSAGTYNWSAAANWQSGVIADGANNTANFTTAGLTGNMIVTLDTARTLGALVFNNPTNSFNWTVNGSNTLTLSNSATGGPSIAVNNTTAATVGVPLAGTQGFTKTGAGMLTLTETNGYSGGTTISDGVVNVNGDANLGTGPVTINVLGTLNFLTTTATAKSFNLTSGGQVAADAGANVTLNVSSLANGYLEGAGTFTTNAAGGVAFTSMTNSASTTIVSANAADQFVNFTNNGALMVAPNVQATAPATLSGFLNQGSASLTLGAVAHATAANFQSFGVVTLNPAVVGSGQYSLLTNTGTTPLAFNIGSRTFIGTPATANFGGNPTFLAGIDLHGQNIHITGGLFVNNGFVEDSVGGGQVIVDAGALYKGAGFSGVPVVTENGGRVQAGNSPGMSSLGSLTIGPGGINNFNWQINDAGSSYFNQTAPGVAGPSPNSNNQVSGWSQLQSKMVFNPLDGSTSTGNLKWTATSAPGNQFTLALETLLGPETTVGTSPDGPMSDFVPYTNYFWPIISYQGTFTGPMGTSLQIDNQLTADTIIDTSLFANLTDYGEDFYLHLDTGNKQVDLVYFGAIPEPGTLALVGLAAAGVAWRRRNSRIRV